MLRAEKAQVIDDLNAVFGETGVVVVTHYKGLTVAEITDLRARMRAAGASFRVTKNKLAQRALDGTSFAGMSPLFKGPTAIAFSKDPTAAPKIVTEFGKKNDKLQIVGGGLSGTLLDAASVRALAELPSLDAAARQADRAAQRAGQPAGRSAAGAGRPGGAGAGGTGGAAGRLSALVNVAAPGSAGAMVKSSLREWL